jgi:hypothetical protein
MAPRKTRVFVSFDFDNDSRLKMFILSQAKLPDSPFEIETGRSTSGPRTGRGERRRAFESPAAIWCS